MSSEKDSDSVQNLPGAIAVIESQATKIDSVTLQNFDLNYRVTSLPPFDFELNEELLDGSREK